MNPAKILVIKTRSLGDTVLLTAPLTELYQAFPQAKIDAVVTDTWAPLLEGFPGVHHIWKYSVQRNKLARIYTLAQLALSLRKENYDAVINLHASPSSSKLAIATGAKVRAIHFHGHRDRNRFSSVTIPGKGILKPIIERDMDSLRALGIHIPAGRLPKIFLQPSEIEEGKRFLKKLNLPTPILGLSLGASRSTKSWPMERFASLALEWCQKQKGSVLAIAGPTEDALIHRFLNAIDDLLEASIQSSSDRASIRNRISSVNHLRLKDLAAILSQISVLASNDSGPRHLAVAMQTPTVTLFGPEDPFEWHPYPLELHPYTFIKNLSCRKSGDPGMPPWCGIDPCITEEHRCMRLIGVDPVFALCQKVAR